MKRKLICLLTAVLLSASLPGCGNEHPQDTAEIIEAEEVTTEEYTTEEPTTEETKSDEPVINITKYEALDIAEKAVKFAYEDYSPVVIGDVSINEKFSEVVHEHDDGTKYLNYDVTVKGHCWMTDSYGHNAGSQDFSELVHIDSDTGELYFFSSIDGKHKSYTSSYILYKTSPGH